MNPEKNSNTFRFMRKNPAFGARVYVAPAAHVSGSVTLGDDASIWPMAVVRGDVNRIVLGARTNVQDGCVLHVTHESDWQPEGGPLLIGDDVTIGHAAVLHACTLGDRCLVGMGAVVLDGAVLEPDSLVAAGSVVSSNKRVESGTLWRGNPARPARDLTEAEISYLRYSARHYVKLKDLYLAELG
jgi:carbonic anhydrase/acetyltransferase-like protein (isoleucine patch superfamily)